jgi:hypothetical protein
VKREFVWYVSPHQNLYSCLLSPILSRARRKAQNDKINEYDSFHPAFIFYLVINKYQQASCFLASGALIFPPVLLPPIKHRDQPRMAQQLSTFQRSSTRLHVMPEMKMRPIPGQTSSSGTRGWGCRVMQMNS